MSFKELLVSKDKCTSIISRQMEAIVFIIPSNIFAARRTKCSRKVYRSLTGMFTFQCSLVRLHKQTNMSLLCKNTKTLSYLEFYSWRLRDSLREYHPTFLFFRWGVSSNMTFWDQTRLSKNISWITIHNYSSIWRWLVVDIYRAASHRHRGKQLL